MNNRRIATRTESNENQELTANCWRLVDRTWIRLVVKCTLRISNIKQQVWNPCWRIRCWIQRWFDNLTWTESMKTSKTFCSWILGKQVGGSFGLPRAKWNLKCRRLGPICKRLSTWSRDREQGQWCSQLVRLSSSVGLWSEETRILHGDESSRLSRERKESQGLIPIHIHYQKEARSEWRPRGHYGKHQQREQAPKMSLHPSRWRLRLWLQQLRDERELLVYLEQTKAVNASSCLPSLQPPVCLELSGLTTLVVLSSVNDETSPRTTAKKAMTPMTCTTNASSNSTCQIPAGLRFEEAR